MSDFKNEKSWVSLRKSIKLSLFPRHFSRPTSCCENEVFLNFISLLQIVHTLEEVLYQIMEHPDKFGKTQTKISVMERV